VYQELQTAAHRARSKWSSRREKTERRMSSFSDCAVDPEPEQAPAPLRRLRAALPLQPRLLLASMLMCCSPTAPPDLPAGSRPGPRQRARGAFLVDDARRRRWPEPPLNSTRPQLFILGRDWAYNKFLFSIKKKWNKNNFHPLHH
jgi:hypothetical protein